MGKENILSLLRNGRKYTVPGKGLGYKEGQRSGVTNAMGAGILTNPPDDSDVC